MESATWCRTPAAASAARRLRPEVSKNSSAAPSSNEGELARSITTCAPATASSRPSPVMVLTPVLGEAATTSWPPRRRMATVFEPIRPVPPMTTILMVHPFASAGDRRPALSCAADEHLSAADEGEKVGVHDLGMGRAHAVRESLVDLECALLQQLDREQCRIGDRHDLVVVPVHHEHRHVDDLQVLGEVRLREGLDAVVMGLGAAHHALAPPVLDHGLGRLRAGPVEAVEGAA